MKKLKKKLLSFIPSNKTITILTLLFSLVAIIISVMSYQVSQNAFNLSEKEFDQDRQIILKGQFTEDFKIKVVPIDQSFHFLKGRAYIPSKIYQDEIPIQGDGNFWHMGSIEFHLNNFIDTTLITEANFITIGEMSIPIVIDSYYAIKGESYSDRSLYSLDLIIQNSNEESKYPTKTPLGLVYLNRLGFDDNDFIKNLDELFEQKASDKE